MATRICPVPVQQTKTGILNPKIMDKTLLNINNTDSYHTKPYYEFKLRNLDNKKYVYYDEVHRRLMLSYRQLYMNYSAYVLEKFGNNKKAVAILDTMNKYISPVRFPMYQDEESQMAYIYKRAEALKQAREWAQMALRSSLDIINNQALRDGGRIPTLFEEIMGRQGAYKAAAQSYVLLEDYDNARKILQSLYEISLTTLQTPSYDQYKDKIQQGMMDIISNIAGVDEEQINVLVQKGRLKEALALANKRYEEYNKSEDPYYKQMSMFLLEKINNIKNIMPIADNSEDKSK
jgi:HSP20 family molecular chaperone IbpA